MGKITIKVNTKGYGNKKLSKTISVLTNDPTQESLVLQIEGHVDRFVDIKPTRVRMTGQVGQEIFKEVSIVPVEKYPFRILDASPQKEGNIRVAVTEDKDKKAYRLTIFNLRQEKTRYYDAVIIKTDSSIRPELTISVYCNIAEKREKRDGQG
ncbi:hypothetical protein dsmv_2964 [Desulfococcus multivorans DSM 2059]|uniref:Uncharacterized protein n=1 Tax=Desulfococcus multivorans DSM 2059 TaxID=1121405 RepID=S7TKT2_DESML|nr:conserved uncharacterized protein [Desulfococcus multivorans]EPR37802.1 hypothetical protein dsmv_2964 [Desulfococcus multivorans DSM 2059]SJZ91854.1 hypothetical protein SAMN02745446_02066 [Desulfococcus multivorans DSM 2059]